MVDSLRDYKHASRLYVANRFELAPRTKFLFYVVFNINYPGIKDKNFQQKNGKDINYLVKKTDLPKYEIEIENLNQYNRKTTAYKKIVYQPINLTFHDDNNSTSNNLWALYYSHYFRDRLNASNGETSPAAYKRTTYKDNIGFIYGLGPGQPEPFFDSIQLVSLSRHTFQSYLLCNPKITRWEHDTLDQSENGGIVENSLTIVYDSVIYSNGTVSKDSPTGFAKLHYDEESSPLLSNPGSLNSKEPVDPWDLNADSGNAKLSEEIRNQYDNNQSATSSDGYLTQSQNYQNQYYNAGSYYNNGQYVNTPSFINPTAPYYPNTTSGFQNYSFGSLKSTGGLTGTLVGAGIGLASKVISNIASNGFSFGSNISGAPTINQSGNSNSAIDQRNREATTGVGTTAGGEGATDAYSPPFNQTTNVNGNATIAELGPTDKGSFGINGPAGQTVVQQSVDTASNPGETLQENTQTTDTNNSTPEQPAASTGGDVGSFDWNNSDTFIA
jgi:hypothetical protein